eukprot:8099823-Pyramimonas_sp.AAC.1
MLPAARHSTGATKLLGTPSFDCFKASEGFLDAGLVDAGPDSECSGRDRQWDPARQDRKAVSLISQADGAFLAI